MKKMRVLGAVATTAIAIGLMATEGMAATTATVKPQHKMSMKAIYFGKELISKPAGFVVNQTTYMPLWYVMQALDTVGIKYKWTSTKSGFVWNITTPSSLKVDLSKISVGTGSISIYINGTLVKKVSGIIDIDPSSGKPTTYLPVWYVMDTLNRLGVKSGWTGTAWTLTQTALSSGAPTGSTSTGTSGTGHSSGSGSGTDSSGSNGSTSGSSGSATPVPIPQPPVDTTPQASQLPGMVSKGQLFSDLANLLKLSAGTVPTTSPYDDLPSSSPYYYGDLAAMNAGLAKPFYQSTQSGVASHFGTGDVVTLQDAEKFYWTYLNIQYPSYQPGGSMGSWATSIGLTNGLQLGSQYLSLTDEQKLVQNLTSLLNGQVTNGSTIEMRYTPHDEYNWTFAGDVDNNGVPLYSGSAIQTAITKTYAFYNAITMQVIGTDLQVNIPIDADKMWFAYVTSQNGVQYSTDGGATWTTVGVFDGSTITANGTVLVRAPLADGMSITYNNMLSQAKGSIILGWVNLSQNETWSSGTANGSSTSPVVVDRVTLT